MTCILGIDPGSRTTGYGLIRIEAQKITYVDSGTINATDDHLPTRLKKIFLGIKEIASQYQPDEAAIEQVFMHANAGTAIKLGQARGAAIVALANLEMNIAEYTARQIKQSVVGYGNADKTQVGQMVRHLLQLRVPLKTDAADALAAALCHAHSRTSLNGLIEGRSYRKGRVW
jgi:crossover junction endodeoxyribonuclease RuvC